MSILEGIVKILNKLYHRDNLIVIERDKLDKLLNEATRLRHCITVRTKTDTIIQACKVENMIVELYVKEK